MQVILSNFNHEVIAYFPIVSATHMAIQRWMIASCALGMQRLVVEECLKYVRRYRVLLLIFIPMQVVKSTYCVRKAFAYSSSSPGQASRNDFSRRVFPELARVGDLSDEQRKFKAGWDNRLVKTVCTFSHTIAYMYLYFCRYITRTGREIAEDASQIFGGRSITVSGMGKLIENVRSTALLHPASKHLTDRSRFSFTEHHLMTLSSEEARTSW
jgi:hypothetical protein